MLKTTSLKALTLPIFIQNITHSVVMLIDFLFFGYLSDSVAGVIGQLLPFFMVGAFVIPVFAGTGISVASQFMGAKQHDKVIPTYMTNLLLCFTMGLVLGVLMLIFSGDIGIWIGMSKELADIGGKYFGVVGYYFILLGPLVAYNAILSARGLTGWLLYSAGVVAIVNLALNCLFVFVFDWGVGGVALASVMGVGVALMASIYLVHFRLKIRFYLKGAIPAMRGVLPPMMRLGISNALEPFSYSVQQIVLATFIVSMGLTAMATSAYALRAQMLQIAFSMSLASGAQILMAHWVGAGRFKDVDRMYKKTIAIGATTAFLFSAVLYIFAESVFAVFTDDPEILALGRSILLVSLFLEPARAVNIITGFSLRTVGDATFPLLVAILFIWGILPVIFAIDAYAELTLFGLWTCFAADELIRAAINFYRWRTGKWKAMSFVRE